MSALRHTFVAPRCTQALTVLYADEDLLLIDKPSGLLSVPGRLAENHDSVISRVQQDHPEARIVHRLDMDTSGIMVIALGADNHRHLSRQFQDRQVEKSYQAWVAGQPAQPEGCVDLPLICDWPNRPRQKVDHELGKNALTHYRVLTYDASADRSLLELIPVTGRSHQLRVHMQALGHPILGCCFYAPPAIAQASPRLLLHAHQLRLRHPRQGHWLAMTAPLPF